MIKKFDLQQEWNFITDETIKKAPKNILSAPWVANRELLLKAQFLLAKIENEQVEMLQLTWINQYFLITDTYHKNLNGHLN
jgi:hypothetical protein